MNTFKSFARPRISKSECTCTCFLIGLANLFIWCINDMFVPWINFWQLHESSTTVTSHSVVASKILLLIFLVSWFQGIGLNVDNEKPIRCLNGVLQDLCMHPSSKNLSRVSVQAFSTNLKNFSRFLEPRWFLVYLTFWLWNISTCSYMQSLYINLFIVLYIH